ncbi:amidase [Rubrivirga litoralis]|uniref:Amidase n=1 Tax=Rubrivirga litoralis TaxID=3075598 RepID=A0ABU3BPF8_9BACT|nr:amidase [Rubrivirga sp. F394]MDT0631174.1 amidase [Rubrivirga sp. F394]
MHSRRRFLASTLAAGAALPVAALPAPLADHRPAPGAPPGAVPMPEAQSRPVTVGEIAAAEAVFGLSFTPDQRELMLDDVNDRLEQLAAIRAAEPPNSVPPALALDLGLSGEARPAPGAGASVSMPAAVRRRPSDQDLAFASIPELGALLRGGAVTAVGLAELFLDRLARFDSRLQAVVTLTRERALETARARDAELAAGIDLGPLHGIPYGAKDLLAARGYPTTWGAEPYRDQVIDEDAAAVSKLEAAGAVLVAKLTLGALAWGDVWFGGTTKNPWNPDEGASGSSAGPGAAVAAGLVPFAIGSETLGSIVSPSTRNGVTGLRPTFGRVPTRGAMALSWSMDKLGPMARSAVDCALVFDALRGADPEAARPALAPDPAFPFDPASPLGDLRVGVLAGAFEADGAGGAADRATLAVLERLGVETRPVALPSGVPVDALLLILEAEAAAAFDGLTRSGGVDRLVRQTRDAWPNVFRHGHLVPAVDYLNANRLRTVLMREMAALFDGLDVLVTPSFGNAGLAITNLTGHPAAVVPNGFFPVEGSADRRSPHSVTFLGPLWQDHLPLRLAHAVQEATDFHTRRPPVS